jgi:hypothetical protein
MHCVLPKTSFDFSSSTGTTTVVAARLCGVPARTPARLLLRVHALDLRGHSGNAIELRVRPTVEVPGAASWFTTAEVWLVAAAAGPAPNLVIAAQSRPLPPSLCAEVVATRGGGTVSATLSADLIV